MKEISEFIIHFVFIYFPIMNALVYFDYRPGHSLGGIFLGRNRKTVNTWVLKVHEGFHWNKHKPLIFQFIISELGT